MVESIYTNRNCCFDVIAKNKKYTAEEELLYNFYLNVTHWASVNVNADSEANCSSINIHL